ncbi:MAG: signal peptidase I [Chloroflexota bacterium]
MFDRDTDPQAVLQEVARAGEAVVPSVSGEPSPEPWPNSADGVSELPARRDGSGLKTLLIDILETLLLTVIIYAVLSTFIGRYKVLSISMEPTLHEGQYLLISKQTHKVWPLQRGDVIVFRFPRSPEKYYIKRLIGLPGEEVELKNGQLYVDGVLTLEPWLNGLQWRGSGTWQLGEEEYFVMGDNRNSSSDSRAWGPVSRDQLIGKAVFRYWPVQDVGFIQHGPKPTATPRLTTPFESLLISPLPASGP